MMNYLCRWNMLVLSAGAALWTSAAAADGESQYFKEIVQGRCYFRPPHDNAGSCPALVGGLVGVMESHLDRDIHASDFDAYFKATDMASPNDHALIWLHFLGTLPDETSESFQQALLVGTPPGLVTPEDTPGGSLLKDLVFCGVDQRQNCSVEKSNAYWTFWRAAYAEFASCMTGHVQIVVEPLSDVEFLEKSVIAHMDPSSVSSVTVYYDAATSSKRVDQVKSALESAGIRKVSVNDDLGEFIFCQDPKSAQCVKHLGGTPPPEQEKGMAESERVHVDEHNKEPEPLSAAITAPSTPAPSSATTTTGKNSPSHAHCGAFFFWLVVLVATAYVGATLAGINARETSEQCYTVVIQWCETGFHKVQEMIGVKASETTPLVKYPAASYDDEEKTFATVYSDERLSHNGQSPDQ